MALLRPVHCDEFLHLFTVCTDRLTRCWIEDLLQGLGPVSESHSGEPVLTRDTPPQQVVAGLQAVYHLSDGQTTIGLGAGSELRRPMALVVIGGLITSTALTLLIIPAVYSLFDRSR